MRWFVLVFAIAFALFVIGPPLLSEQFPPYPLTNIGDWLDVLTPLVLIPLYWAMYRLDRGKEVELAGALSFLVLAAFWVESQGMHLSANSIGHWLKGMEGSDAYKLANFYDEVFSHYLWHFGIVSLSALLIFRQWRNPFNEERVAVWPLVVAGVIYGFTFFTAVVEGRTAPLGVPFVVLVTLFCLIWGRRNMAHRPILFFFFTGYVVATVLFIAWGIYWGGLPEFSSAGIID